MLLTAATRMVYCADTKVLNNFTDAEEYFLTDADMDAIEEATYMYDYRKGEFAQTPSH